MVLKTLYQEYTVPLKAKTEQNLRDSTHFSDEKTMARQTKRQARATELNDSKTT